MSIRKTLGLYANVRPCVSYYPYVESLHKNMDVVIVRENEEDLYAGIEHRQTADVYQCLKLITRPGCEKIVRYAFEYARANGRKKVTCVVKDNIMKLTDGLFYKVFEEIGKAEYPDIGRDRIIVDIGAALLASNPEKFDVMVLPNLYGDILSDIAAQISGSVGLGGSANIGEHIAMFEAVHGSAPDIAGKNIANPSGLLLGAVQMLTHIGHPVTATTVYNAWLKTLEDGLHTGDIYREGVSKKKMSTTDFTAAVIDRLGQQPVKAIASNAKPKVGDVPSKEKAKELAQKKSAATPPPTVKWSPPPQQKVLHGVDVFLDYKPTDADALAAALQTAAAKVPALRLSLITNRGVKVWPGGFPETFKVDHWRCRFRAAAGDTAPINYNAVLDIMREVHAAGFDVIKSENLCLFKNEDGSYSNGFSLGQGE